MIRKKVVVRSKLHHKRRNCFLDITIIIRMQIAAGNAAECTNVFLFLKVSRNEQLLINKKTISLQRPVYFTNNLSLLTVRNMGKKQMSRDKIKRIIRERKLLCFSLPVGDSFIIQLFVTI